MGVLKQAILVAMLAVTVFSEKLSYTPTEYPPTTTMEGIDCMCLPCSENIHFYTKHTQNDFCDASAVIQGRVTQKSAQDTPKGIWNLPVHTDFFKRGFPNSHFELTVRVLAIYANGGDTKIAVGDKIIVRYARWSYCAACQTKVENFHDEQWDDRDIERAEKYVFFIPLLKDGYGDRPEATLAQCSRVWRYSKRGKVIDGWVPLVQRYMLTTTSCDKCRISGCYQNKCVKVEEEEMCMNANARYEFKEKTCKAIMDKGLCYYHAGTDSCRWTGISDGGFRSRKMIEHCFDEKE